MGQDVGNFYKIKNKEQGSNYRAPNWPGVWGSADWLCWLSGQLEHLQGHNSYLNFDLLARWEPL